MVVKMMMISCLITEKSVSFPAYVKRWVRDKYFLAENIRL